MPSSLLEISRLCNKCLEAQEDVKLSEEGIEAAAASITASAVNSACKPFKYPCKFDNTKHEISFMALMRMLEFGSGYDHLLASKDQKCAKDVIQMGVIGLHMSGSALDTAACKEFNHQQLIQLFNLDSHVESDSGIPGVSMSKPGPLAGWTQQLVKAVTTAGEALDAEGSDSLGDFVLNCMKDCTAGGKPPRAAYLIAELASSVPAFADEHAVSGSKVPFNRKAQLLAADLFLRFQASEPLFAFSDAAEMTCDSGAHAAAQLRARGCLDYSQQLASSVAAGTELPGGAAERAVRCGAVAAGGALAAAIGVDAWQLGRWLQQQLDGGQESDLVLHRTVQTTAY